MELDLPCYGLHVEVAPVDARRPAATTRPADHPIAAVALDTPGRARVFTGTEPSLLALLDAAVRELPPGWLVTATAGEPLGHLAARARRLRVTTGLEPLPTPLPLGTAPAPAPGSGRARWYDHRHLALAVPTTDPSATPVPGGLTDDDRTTAAAGRAAWLRHLGARQLADARGDRPDPEAAVG